MQTTDRATFNALQWMRRGVVVLFALLILAGAVIVIVGALQIGMAPSSAFFVNPSFDSTVDAPNHLPFGLEADPAEHELYRQLDEQCREQLGSGIYAPLPDCR